MTRDAGAPPTWPVAGSGDNATAVGLYSAIVTALYRRERTGKGSYVTTSLLAEGVWSASVFIQAALCEAKFFGLHNRKDPANAALNVYRASDGTWFVLIVTPDKLSAVAKAIGRPDLLTDPRFSDPAKLVQNMPQLTAILDEVFGSQPMTYWYDVFNGVHVTFGAVRGPQDVIEDPQLRLNDIVVPLEGAGGKLTTTISSPIQVHGVAKRPAKRAPELGEHNEEVLAAARVQRDRNRRFAGKRRRFESIDCQPYVEKRNPLMTQTRKPSDPNLLADKAAVGRLFVLDASGNRIQSMNTDGSDRKTVVADCRAPDGIVVDAQAGHIYWTNMGVVSMNDGSIERANLDGKNRKVIIPLGATFTPKQIHLDKENGKLYWCDREGMRVLRSNLDGSHLETLVETGRGDVDRRDLTRWCVGITIDPERQQIYWTQKGPDNAGLGRIFRANIDIPRGECAANRSDIEVLFDRLPEPIDLELDLENRILYWTDRGDPPRGNTVNRASIDARPTPDPQIVLNHLMEGIGIALDVPGNRMFLTDLAGSIYSARLDGSEKRNFLFLQGNLTGIAYAEI